MFLVFWASFRVPSTTKFEKLAKKCYNDKQFWESKPAKWKILLLSYEPQINTFTAIRKR